MQKSPWSHYVGTLWKLLLMTFPQRLEVRLLGLLNFG
jgi:hypothetical protein